jgi:D-alanine-D-alanine ligase
MNETINAARVTDIGMDALDRLAPTMRRLRRREAEMRTLKIGVLCGGLSGEREVSLVSGESVHKALSDGGYDSILVDVTAENWRSLRLNRFDVLFNVMHGLFGEDGCFEGYFELLGIPYVGTDVYSSAMAMNKRAAKQGFVRLGIPTPAFAYVDRFSLKELDGRLESMRKTLVVKPNNQGSSLDITMTDSKMVAARLAGSLAAKYGGAIIEEKVAGREITIPVIGNADPVALPLIEIAPARRSFYDYTAKYTNGETKYVCPAPISRRVAQDLAENARTFYKDSGLTVYCRFDAIVNSRGKGFFLEVNTLPGFTPLSLVPMAAKSAGISYLDLLLLLIYFTLEKWEGRK